MLPATLAVSVAQISLIINTNIAARLESGSVSWLSYADRIMELPTALLGVALGTVLLPNLTKAWSENNNNKTFHAGIGIKENPTLTPFTQGLEKKETHNKRFCGKKLYPVVLPSTSHEQAGCKLNGCCKDKQHIPV